MSEAHGARRKWTYDDLARLPADGLRHEIIDGEHFVTPSPVTRHQAVLGRLYLALGNFLTAHPELGQVYISPLDVLFSRFDVVEPDLLFVAADQLDIVHEKNVRGAPALVVEILSDSTRAYDERTKRRLYARGGVQEYWIVDPARNVVTVYRRMGSRMLCRAATHAASDRAALTTPLLAGFSAPLDVILA